MNHKTVLASCTALIALAASASAAVLVDYKMTAPGQAATSALFLGPTATHENIVASNLRNQADAATTGSNNFNGGLDRVSIWSTTTGSGASTAVSYGNAFTAGNYVGFSITAAEGFNIALETISFQVAAATGDSTARRGFFLVAGTSPDDFTASSTVLVGGSDSTPAAGGTIPLQTTDPVFTAPRDYSVSLSSLGTIGAGETLYFRFYLQTQNAGQGLAFDDIVINGTVSAIPEPASAAALAGVVLLGLAATRRRRHA